MPSLEVRSCDPEIIDDAEIDSQEYGQTLRQIEILNRLTLAYRPTLRAVERLARHSNTHQIRVLDIGFGHGDMLRRLRKWSLSRDLDLDLIGLDVNPQAAAIANSATPESYKIKYLTGDVFEGANRVHSDIIINSLVMHHLNDLQIVSLLRWMTITARLGWFVSDLHRHVVPYQVMRVATPLAGFNHLICNDAPLSIARSFRKEDWVKYLDLAGIPSEKAEVTWHLPFRYGVFYRHDGL